MGTPPFSDGAVIDLLHRVVRFFHRIHERERHFLEAHAFKLREQTVAQHLGGDAGAIGNEKRSAFWGHGLVVDAVFR